MTNGLHNGNGHGHNIANGLNSGGAGNVTNGLHTAQLAMITNGSNGIHQQSINGVVFSRQSSVEKVTIKISGNMHLFVATLCSKVETVCTAHEYILKSDLCSTTLYFNK